MPIEPKHVERPSVTRLPTVAETYRCESRFEMVGSCDGCLQLRIAFDDAYCAYGYVWPADAPQEITP